LRFPATSAERSSQCLENIAYLVPKSDISSTVIDDRPELAVLLEVRHEELQSVDTVDEVDNSLLIVLVVDSLPDIVNGLAENGRESDTHGSLTVNDDRSKSRFAWTYVSERVLMVSSV
jgi:hypothetical protein